MVPTKISKAPSKQFHEKNQKIQFEISIKFYHWILQSINQSKPQMHKRTIIINLLISYIYIEYQKLRCHPYRNLEYQLLKLKFNFTNNQKLKNCLTFDQKSNMKLHPLFL